MRQLLEPITQACDHLRLQQNPEGFWVYDLEADATIPAEYILLQRFLEKQIDEVDSTNANWASSLIHGIYI